MQDPKKNAPAPAERAQVGIARRDFLASAAAVVGGIALAGAVTAPSRAQAQSAGDELTAVRYEMTIDGHSLAVFDSLVLIGSEVVPTARRLPGKRTPPTVVLKRGMTRNIEMAAWHELIILSGAANVKSVSITAYNAAGDPIARYHLTDAWPSKVEIGALEAGASEVLLETVTMVATFIQRVAV